jgi:hypothetical protein
MNKGAEKNQGQISLVRNHGITTRWANMHDGKSDQVRDREASGRRKFSNRVGSGENVANPKTAATHVGGWGSAKARCDGLGMRLHCRNWWSDLQTQSSKLRKVNITIRKQRSQSR